MLGILRPRAAVARTPFRLPQPCTPYTRPTQFASRFLSAVTAPPREEQFNVPCRSNGSITVDVFHASKPSPPILIYMPPGPVLPECPERQHRIISALRESSTATVVRINYRASSEHRYPSLHHDALYGLDWIRDNLLYDEFERPYQARLGICGELVGGSIATMMAMTECRIGESRIVAAAVNSPIVDWVFPEQLPHVDPADLPEPDGADETAVPADEDMADTTVTFHITKPKKPARKKRAPKKPKSSWLDHADNSTIPVAALNRERDALFYKMEDYLDRFASPIHFFRSPHAHLVCPIVENPYSPTKPVDPDLDWEAQMSLNHFETFSNLSDSSISPPPPEDALGLPELLRCRSFARGYPQANTKLSLPVWNITTGTKNPLHDQAQELARVLRRSYARHMLKTRSGRTKWFDPGQKKEYEALAEESVFLEASQTTGLWSDKEGNNPAWEADLDNIGRWMRQKLS